MPWTRRKFIKTGIGAGAAFMIANSFWAEKFFIETNEFFLGNSTKSKSDIKVVQISDLHIQSVNYQLRQLAKQLNGLNLDLVLITGDAVDEAKNLPVLNQFLQLLDASIKKVAVLGNWEYWGKMDLNELTQTYTNNNCDLLINACKQYTFRAKTITVTGVDDYIGGHPDIEMALKNYRSSDYHIVLNHCPQYSDTIALKVPKSIPINFILSGHTHGGQINFFGFVPFTPPGSGKYVKGWYNDTGKNMYVSKGVGTKVLPVRFRTRAEIAVFHIAT